MGFFGGPTFDYRQIGGQATNDIIQQLLQFNPYMWLKRPDVVEKGYKTASKQFFEGKTPFDQIAGIAPTLNAISKTYANNQDTLKQALMGGGAGLGDQSLAEARYATLLGKQAQQEAADKGEAVSGYRREATGGYENARQNRFMQALQAAGLSLQGKQSGLQGYLESFKPPTGQGGGLFGKIAGLAGLAAAPFTGGASLALAGGLGKMLGPGAGSYGKEAASLGQQGLANIASGGGDFKNLSGVFQGGDGSGGMRRPMGTSYAPGGFPGYGGSYGQGEDDVSMGGMNLADYLKKQQFRPMKLW